MRTVASSPRLDSTDFVHPAFGVLEQFVDQLHWVPVLAHSAGALETSVPTLSPLTILSMLLSSPMLKT